MLYDLIAKGKFPAQFSLGARAVGWYEEEVKTWARNRRAGTGQSEQDGQFATGPNATMPTLEWPNEEIPGASLDQTRPKPTAAARPTVRTSTAKRTPAFSIRDEGKMGEAMSESEELRLLRKENAQLKKLVGELVLKNSLMQSSVGLKTSSF
jgi:hypothetical protein